MPDPPGVEPGWPLPPRDRGEPVLRVRTRQLATQRLFELCHDIVERHGTIDIDGQLVCGAGYGVVTARTTSAEMNA